MQNRKRTPSSKMLTIKEAANLLNVSPNTIKLWTKIGVLSACRIGKDDDYRFNIEHLEEFLGRM